MLAILGGSGLARIDLLAETRSISARIIIDMKPPKMEATRANTRYIVPMSLWLVEYNQRLMPVG